MSTTARRQSFHPVHEQDDRALKLTVAFAGIASLLSLGGAIVLILN
jgi:hypothetical protein